MDDIELNVLKENKGFPMMRAIPWLLVIVSSILGCAQTEWNPIDRYPGRRRSNTGGGNLYKITDYLYRSGQPTAEGMKNLERMGIKTIINLRVFHSDSDEIRGTGLHYEEVSVNPWHIEDEDVVRVLRIIRQREKGPFLIHCCTVRIEQGVMIAMFRIIEQGWTKEEAIKEMVEGDIDSIGHEDQHRSIPESGRR